MNPIKFEQANIVLAKDQPQYKQLPAFKKIIQAPPVLHPNQPPVSQWTCKYELSELELHQIIRTRSVWFTQYGTHFHPILPQLENPFGYCRVQYRQNEEGNYTLWVATADGADIELKDVPAHNAIETILITVTNITVDQIYFEHKPQMAVGEGGLLTNMP